MINYRGKKIKFNKKIALYLIGFFYTPIAIFSQDSTLTITAEKGDGILSLLKRHGVNPYTLYDEFITLNIENLKDSIHLYEGRNYQIPNIVADTTIKAKQVHAANQRISIEENKYPIFGKKHENITVKSAKLKGAVYYLISGHGGPDPGAMAKYGESFIAEDEYAYDITLRLAKELLSHGALVYMIIEDPNDGIRDKRILAIDHDEVTYGNKQIPLNQLKRLQQRVKIVNKLHKKHSGAFQRLIVTHVDSRSKGQNIDVFFYHHEKSKNGKKLAESIHTTFQKKYKKYQPNRTYTGTFEDRSSLYVVKNTHPATAFIEIGNIQNKKDQKRILVPENRQALAKWIFEGILLDHESGEIGKIR